MNWIIEKSRYMVVISVFALLVQSLIAFLLGVYKTFELINKIIFGFSTDDFSLVLFLKCLDIFLIATALLVIAISLYELFVVDTLDVPEWMLVRNLNELKAKFGFVIVPIIAVKFLEKMLEAKEAIDVFYVGVGVALVISALVFFSYIGGKNKE
ncbi:MAG: YqhA family protein [Pyrinomonadaceae bacterium]|jgi:uncharacterized membrane protein YqhA|nr:YqhA family protein [Pyrinomonadaceae bacterium]